MAPRKEAKNPWRTEEDKMLIELVRLHHEGNWVAIARSLPDRTAKQCRERYHQQLKPGLKSGQMTHMECELIRQMVRDIGPKWAEIARAIGGRSDNAVKNWWNGQKNKQKKQQRAKDTAARSSASSVQPQSPVSEVSSTTTASSIQRPLPHFSASEMVLQSSLKWAGPLTISQAPAQWHPHSPQPSPQAQHFSPSLSDADSSWALEQQMRRQYFEEQKQKQLPPSPPPHHHHQQQLQLPPPPPPPQHQQQQEQHPLPPSPHPYHQQRQQRQPSPENKQLPQPVDTRPLPSSRSMPWSSDRPHHERADSHVEPEPLVLPPISSLVDNLDKAMYGTRQQRPSPMSRPVTTGLPTPSSSPRESPLSGRDCGALRGFSMFLRD